MDPFWVPVEGEPLNQGDYLPRCFVPIFPTTFGSDTVEVQIAEQDLIVITQSCDLENKKITFVALCPLHPLDAFEAHSPEFRKKGAWEQVRQGRKEGLHLLASWDEPGNNRKAIVVDFRQIFSLPIAYLNVHAAVLGQRWRLRSPYLEHYSQAFARFFMRVGLPSSIPKYE